MYTAQFYRSDSFKTLHAPFFNIIAWWKHVWCSCKVSPSKKKERALLSFALIYFSQYKHRTVDKIAPLEAMVNDRFPSMNWILFFPPRWRHVSVIKKVMDRWVQGWKTWFCEWACRLISWYFWQVHQAGTISGIWQSTGQYAQFFFKQLIGAERTSWSFSGLVCLTNGASFYSWLISGVIDRSCKWVGSADWVS